MTDTRTLIKPEAATPSPVAKSGRRVILLSGRWQARIRSVFTFDATIFVSSGGRAMGDIFWINVDTPGVAPGLAGTELVRGMVEGMYVDLEGYQTEAHFVCDRYSIRLCGTAESGEFVGESLIPGWGGAQMSGTYHIVDQPD